MGARRFRIFPPKRKDGVDLSHLHLGPDGVRYADVKKLKEQAAPQLDQIRAKVEESRARHEEGLREKASS